MENLKRIVVGLVAVFLFTGCFPSGNVPLLTLHYESKPRNAHLIVFLQGMGGTLNCITAAHKCFEAEGFVEAVRSRGLPYDMAAPNAHYGYYKGRTLLERLRTDVILPAKARGYVKIWLVGASMGGMGSLLYLKEHIEDIDGVLTMAPFLGGYKILNEIINAGGVRRWNPGQYDEQEDWQRMLWDWLKNYSQHPDDLPPIYLGYGTSDPNAKGLKLLASDLPPQRVITVNGSHSAAVFKQIWEIFLNKEILQ